MSNVVEFKGKPPATSPVSEPYWAGQPLKEAFPARRVRTPAQVKARRLVMSDGDICRVDDDGPEGAA